MLRFLFLTFPLLWILGCSQPRAGRVELPELNTDFYKSALAKVSQEYSDNPSRELLTQKLYYQEKLGWPEESILDLREAEKQFGYTQKVIHYYCDYYYKNGRYFELLQAVNIAGSLAEHDELTRRYEIIGHVHASDPRVANSYLRKFLQDYPDALSLDFGARQYLEMKDTLMAVYYLNKLQKADPGNDLIATILAPSLIQFGYKIQAGRALSEYAKTRPEAAMTVASSYKALGDLAAAKGIYRRAYTNEAYLELTELFRKERFFDSSIFYLDKVLVTDSSDQFILKKGEILEERGWLTSAFFTYQFLLDRNPGDSIALVRSQNVGRKIAYLRRVKEEEGLAPAIRIEPLDLTE